MRDKSVDEIVDKIVDGIIDSMCKSIGRTVDLMNWTLVDAMNFDVSKGKCVAKAAALSPLFSLFAVTKDNVIDAFLVRKSGENELVS